MGGRYALLVATAHYTDPRLRRLRAPVGEAQRLRDLLLDAGIGGFDTVHLVVDDSKAEVERRIEELFSGRGPDDLVLLYLSGHGLKTDHDKLFFAACNTELDRPYATAVASNTVQGLLEECQAGVKMVLLDCCYSGAFSNGLVVRSSTAIDYEAQLLGRGTYVITATGELEYAYEGNELVLGSADSGGATTSSVFTAAVIRGLETGEADGNDDGVITADELYSYVYEQVREANVPQTPTRHDRIKGDFVIARTQGSAWRNGLGSQGGPPTLGTLLNRMVDETAVQPGRREALFAPIGNAQKPGGTVAPVQLDLTGQTGHVIVVGRIFSGKSTLLRTLIIGLAYTRSPLDVQFYCLDSEGRLSVLAGMPHVREVIADDETDAVAKVLKGLQAVILERRATFRQQRIVSMDDIRRRRRRGELPEGRYADVFLVIDGWEAFASGEKFVQDVYRIASMGLGFGVHVVVTARQWDEVPEQVVRLLLGRIELLLDDPVDSRIDPALSASLPELPGWGLYAGRRFQVALPRQDGAETDYDLVSAVENMVDQSEKAWLGHEALTSEDPLNTEPSILAMLGIPGDPTTFDVPAAWRPRTTRHLLRVPFGIGEQGQPVELDLKEPAMEGIGPHGLCIGATGSGKSELLRTLVLALALTHSSSALNMILVDFKGGATFLGLDRLPHVAATITNLADDLTLVDRMRDAIVGEVARRQAQLAKANAKNVWDYEKARENGAALDPLPALFVVIDEFSEMLTAKPDFIDILVQVGRVGRSLHMHLLLASQRLEEGKLRGLDTHLSYRIGLRTFSATESRAAIGVPDAFELPPIPGVGYLAVSGGPMTKFKSAYVSAPCRPEPGVLPELADMAAPTMLDVLVARLANQGPPAVQVWLPPLAESPSLDQLLMSSAMTEPYGQPSLRRTRLQVPIGVVDKPLEQRRDLLWVDFRDAEGHGAIVGGPRSGKSTLLLALVMAMAFSYTPAEVQFYGLDFGGGALGALAGLPHVGSVATKRDPELVRRTIAELELLLNRREEQFLKLGVHSIEEYRDRRQHREFADERYGDVFLLIDGWMGFKQEFDALESQVVRLATDGLGYGVHVILTANRWAEIRPALKDPIGTRLELRLGDPVESDIDRRVAVNVPIGRPGRGLTRERLHFLAGLPFFHRSDNPVLPARHVDAMRRDIDLIAANWNGQPAPAVRLLPHLLSYEDLRAAVGRPGKTSQVPIGVNEEELAPVFLDFDAEQHFVAFADGESGKTNLLRVIARGIVTNYAPDEARIVLVDYRRTMLEFVTTEHQIAYAPTGRSVEDLVKDVITVLTERLPGPDVTPEQLREQSWWRGPKLFVVVDDYDLVATQSGNPLQPLTDFLPQAKDVGLHLIVARRTGGAARSMFDPVLRTLKEIGSPGFVGSGSKEEGVLWETVRPTAEPAGRGTIVSKKLGRQRVQVAWLDPEPAQPGTRA
jgi:S-DNA-T family DNA segregation ATPase FtsK/SpoIIIE